MRHNIKTHIIVFIVAVFVVWLFKDYFFWDEKTEASTTMEMILDDENAFIPSDITINAGDYIRWVNNSIVAMQPASNPHPVHTDYVDLNMSEIGPGSSATSVALTKVGTWGYHNHIGPGGGTITVNPSVSGGGSTLITPFIVSLKVKVEGQDVILTWTTNVPTKTLFIYDLKSSLEFTDHPTDPPYQGHFSEDDYSLYHVQIISSLIPSTKYYYKIYSQGDRNNSTVSEAYSFISPARSESAKIPARVVEKPEQITDKNPLPDSRGTELMRPDIKQKLVVGKRGEEVLTLQLILSHDLGVDSEEIVTGYFGQLTKMKVKQFQEKYLISGSGQPGYGIVGPRTRKKLNEFLQQAK